MTFAKDQANDKEQFSAGKLWITQLIIGDWISSSKKWMITSCTLYLSKFTTSPGFSNGGSFLSGPRPHNFSRLYVVSSSCTKSLQRNDEVMIKIIEQRLYLERVACNSHLWLINLWPSKKWHELIFWWGRKPEHLEKTLEVRLRSTEKVHHLSSWSHTLTSGGPPRKIVPILSTMTASSAMVGT